MSSARILEVKSRQDKETEQDSVPPPLANEDVIFEYLDYV